MPMSTSMPMPMPMPMPNTPYQIGFAFFVHNKERLTHMVDKMKLKNQDKVAKQVEQCLQWAEPPNTCDSLTPAQLQRMLEVCVLFQKLATKAATKAAMSK
jgi:hypothetical protein